MGRWLRKQAAKLVDKVADKLPDRVGDRLENLTTADYGGAVGRLKEIAHRTETAASETMEICASTQAKREQI
jgi:hypothetical protein